MKITAKTSENEMEQNTEPVYQADTSVMYYIVFCGISEYFELKPIEVAIMSFVGSFNRKGKTCYASKRLLARIARTTEQSVYSALKKLKNRELLKQSYRKGKVCLDLSPEVAVQLKYVEECIRKRKKETEELYRPLRNSELND